MRCWRAPPRAAPRARSRAGRRAARSASSRSRVRSPDLARAQPLALLEQVHERLDPRAKNVGVERLGDVVRRARGVALARVLSSRWIAVRKMMGSLDARGRCPGCRRATSKPSIPGIWTSSRTTANDSRPTFRWPPPPSAPRRCGPPAGRGRRSARRGSPGCRRRRGRCGAGLAGPVALLPGRHGSGLAAHAAWPSRRRG